MSLRFGTDGNSINFMRLDGLCDVAEVRNIELVCKQLVPVVCPSRARFFVGDELQLKTRVLGYCSREVVVFYHAENTNFEWVLVQCGRLHEMML